MKVITEANNAKVQDIKNQLENAKSVKDKIKVLDNEFNDIQSWGELRKKFSDDFLVSWVQAMKVDEILNKNNVFMSILDTNKGFNFVTKNPALFTKVYNVYANNVYGKSDLNTEGDYHIIYNTDLYRRDDKDSIKIAKMWYDGLQEAGEDKTKILKLIGTIFDVENLEDFSYDDIETGPIKTLAEIGSGTKDRELNYDEEKANTVDNKIKQQIDDLIKDENAVEYIKSALNAINY